MLPSCLTGGAVELAGGVPGAAATATNPIMALSTGSSGPAASGAAPRLATLVDMIAFH